MSNEGKNALIQELFPLCTILTPNLPEVAAILDTKVAETEQEMIEQGRRLLALGPKAILIKGGHLSGEESPDWLVTKEEEVKFEGKRIKR
jgi:hydroxymethylpyrimidine/phosphomethylpyrimidine kinase